MTVLIAFTRNYPHGKEVRTSCDNKQCRKSWSQRRDLGVEMELGGKALLSGGAGALPWQRPNCVRSKDCASSCTQWKSWCTGDMYHILLCDGHCLVTTKVRKLTGFFCQPGF